jgi:hypothetical protein
MKNYVALKGSCSFGLPTHVSPLRHFFYPECMHLSILEETTVKKGGLKSNLKSETSF